MLKMTSLFLALFLAPAFSFAAGLSCASGEYSLELKLNDLGNVSQVKLSNLDWGQAGIGDWQTVSEERTDSYVVTTDKMTTVGLQSGSSFRLVRDQHANVVSVAFPASGATVESYRCQ